MADNDKATMTLTEQIALQDAHEQLKTDLENSNNLGASLNKQYDQVVAENERLKLKADELEEMREAVSKSGEVEKALQQEILDMKSRINSIARIEMKAARYDALLTRVREQCREHFVRSQGIHISPVAEASKVAELKKIEDYDHLQTELKLLRKLASDYVLAERRADEKVVDAGHTPDPDHRKYE